MVRILLHTENGCIDDLCFVCVFSERNPVDHVKVEQGTSRSPIASKIEKFGKKKIQSEELNRPRKYKKNRGKKNISETRIQ